MILNQIIWEYFEGKPAIDDGDVWFEAVSHCPIEIVAVPINRGTLKVNYEFSNH